MSVELFTNNASSTLNGGINSSVTSLVVNSAATFPASGNFRIIVDNEIILVGSVSGNTFSNLSRGIENTTAAIHANGATVTHILTAGSMKSNPRSMLNTGDIEYLSASGLPASLIAPVDGIYSIQFASGIPSYVTASSGGGAALPTGVFAPFAGTVAPNGHLMCNGQAVSRTTYANLFAVIGTTYGAGDGVTTFNVPNMQQRFPLGKASSGTGSTLGSTGGQIDHTHTIPALAINASGVLDIVTGASNASAIGSDASFGDPTLYSVAEGRFRGVPNSYTSGGIGSGTGLGAATHSHGGITGTGISGTNNPPYLVANYIIGI